MEIVWNIYESSWSKTWKDDTLINIFMDAKSSAKLSQDLWHFLKNLSSYTKNTGMIGKRNIKVFPSKLPLECSVRVEVRTELRMISYLMEPERDNLTYKFL